MKWNWRDWTQWDRRRRNARGAHCGNVSEAENPDRDIEQFQIVATVDQGTFYDVLFSYLGRPAYGVAATRPRSQCAGRYPASPDSETQFVRNDDKLSRIGRKGTA